MVPDPTDTPARVAFAIGRAVGPAVVRNRMRRRLREILRDCPLAPGLYLVGATPQAASLTFAELAATVDDLVHRLDRRLGVSP